MSAPANGFKDIFSKQSAEYAKYRPTYPEALFRYLASLPPRHERLWDCGTGNGQAAVGLAPYFKEVIATDASASQLSKAKALPNITYRVARAEEPGLADKSVDLITVAQAFHWFNFDAFFSEARRVAAPGGLLAIWCYSLCLIAPDIDECMKDYYDGIIGKFWEPERKLVDDEYRTIPFPFDEISTPKFEIALDWSFEHLLGYLSSWSATQTAMRELGKNPIEEISGRLEKAWGPRQTLRRVRWPIAVRVGRLDMPKRDA